MPYADTCTGRLFYSLDGCGAATLLLVHGWACDSNDWIWQIPDLSASYRVLAPDLRGHGHSAAPGHGYGLADYTGDLVELIEHVDAGPVVAIGHSMGAMVVSLLAADHPELVRAVAVVDPAYGFDADDALAARRFAEEVRSGDVTAALQRVDDADAATQQSFLRAWHRRRASAMAPDVINESVLAIHGIQTPLVDRPQTGAVLERRRIPTFALHTRLATAAWEQALLKDPLSEVVCWEGMGHWPHQERPEEFNQLILKWLHRVTDREPDATAP